MTLLDGKKIAQTIQHEIAEKVQARIEQGLKTPHLAAVLVGNNPASQTYVQSKIATCNRVGFHHSLIHLPDSISENDLLIEINKLNNDEKVDGYIVQLPLPKHINEKKILLAIHPDKDVDGFHPTNFGKMAQGMPSFVPATPLGIMELLKRYEIPIEGKHCVVLGRSHIVGLPISILMAQNTPFANATVTLLHSKSQHVKAICNQADILIVAIGKPNYITNDYVRKGAVVVDVGIHRIDDCSSTKGYSICGDVHFDEVKEVADFITPVPGGVGPMTICGLLLNTLKAVERK